MFKFTIMLLCLCASGCNLTYKDNHSCSNHKNEKIQSIAPEIPELSLSLMKNWLQATEPVKSTNAHKPRITPGVYSTLSHD